MAIKPFEQVYPGQNAPDLKPKKNVDPGEWERKQRMKEYRIAARREKRNRKSDEKKQRTLNATILRRMTRNPDKYTRNAKRNQLQAIQQERRQIHSSAICMVQRLAAVYDPSGALFNVGPVLTLEDGRVVSVEAMERKREREEQKATKPTNAADEPAGSATQNVIAPEIDQSYTQNNIHHERQQMMEDKKPGHTLSKTQQRKQALLAPRPPPPKPRIPEGIDIPSDEEENWLELWDIDDNECERRVVRKKNKAARERKEFRQQQKSGKAERRAARDEKRKVYREVKQSWQVMRQEERRRRRFLESMEDEERRRLAVQVNQYERQLALEAAAVLGFTLTNVPGVDEIQPVVPGMKGVDIDFSKLEPDGDKSSGLIIHEDKPRHQYRGNRVDLGAVPEESKAQSILATRNASGANSTALGQQDFVGFGHVAGQDQEAQTLSYNHKTRRKLRKAIETAQIAKEVLVRKAAIEYCEKNDHPVPPSLMTAEKPISIKGQRTLPSGELETQKQERTRAKVELTEFNKQAKVLRAQAKAMAMEAGMRIYLELMGRIPKREGLDEEIARRAAEKGGLNGPAAIQEMTRMADLIASWPMPEEGLGQLEGGFEDHYEYGSGVHGDEQGDHDMGVEVKNGTSHTNGADNGFNMGDSVSESEADDSDEEMSDSSSDEGM